MIRLVTSAGPRQEMNHMFCFYFALQIDPCSNDGGRDEGNGWLFCSTNQHGPAR